MQWYLKNARLRMWHSIILHEGFLLFFNTNARSTSFVKISHELRFLSPLTKEQCITLNCTKIKVEITWVLEHIYSVKVH